MKVDKATSKHEKLQYARVLIEVKVDQEFLSQLDFINEKGTEIVFNVIYEWKSVLCSVCKQLGHGKDECKKSVVR